MPTLRLITPRQDQNYAGQKGLGTRAFCKRASLTMGWGLGPQLYAVRNFQALNVATNPIVASHMESRNGFVQVKAGLRDSGSVEFDANYVPEYAQWQLFRDAYANTLPAK